RRSDSRPPPPAQPRSRRAPRTRRRGGGRQGALASPSRKIRGRNHSFGRVLCHHGPGRKAAARLTAEPSPSRNEEIGMTEVPAPDAALARARRRAAGKKAAPKRAAKAKTKAAAAPPKAPPRAKTPSPQAATADVKVEAAAQTTNLEFLTQAQREGLEQ